MFTDKMKWVYRLLRSRTYVLLLDKGCVVNIPLTNINSFESTLLLSAQTAALYEFKSRLEGLIGEHEDAITLLAHRQGVQSKAAPKKSSSSKSGSKVRKSPARKTSA